MSTYKDFVNKLFMTPIKSDYMVMILRSIALILVVTLTYLIYNFWETNLSLIGALGILISALLASYSVIVNIDTTINLKNREISNQIRNVFFQLCLIKMRLIGLEREKFRETITYIDVDRIFDTVEDIHNLLSEIKSHDIVSIAHNSVLSDVHFIYLELTTLHTHLRAAKKNLIRPAPQTDNQPIYPNPLNRTDFRLPIAIERLSNVLTYLREGYEKDFPKNSGIEHCADYIDKKLNPQTSEEQK